MAWGVCSCRLQAGQLGCVLPTLLQGGDKDILSTPWVPSPYYVLGIMRGATGAPTEIQTDLLLTLLSKEKDFQHVDQQTVTVVGALKMWTNSAVGAL